jgi:hypothetical protein
MLDGGQIAALGRGASVEMELPSGTHTLQLVSRHGLCSNVETFSVRAGETAAFACQSPSLIAAIPRLVIHRGSWIALDRTGHRETGGDGTSPEQPGELIKQIQAAQANQPGIRR